MIERVTNTIAAGAVASPWWLPSLEGISQVAALLLPVIGCAWLLLQIVWKITERK
jgi:hypothetical protein